VTGASRGVGKGIALELGAAGATVYCAGRCALTLTIALHVPLLRPFYLYYYCIIFLCQHLLCLSVVCILNVLQPSYESLVR
jgi:hypothetical protein